jgi:hypothetical protein
MLSANVRYWGDCVAKLGCIANGVSTVFFCRGLFRCPDE